MSGRWVAAGPAEGGAREPRSYGWAEVALAVVFVTLVAVQYKTSEDAWISFRYAHNLAVGRGLVFNQGGEPVEGYSNLLWTLLAVPFEALGWPTQHLMNALSTAAGLGLLAELRRACLVYFGASRRTARLVVLLCIGMPGITFWSTSGLEVIPQTLLFFVAATGLAMEMEPRRSVWICLATAGLILIRSEGVLWVPVLALLGLLLRRSEGRGPGPVPAVLVTAALTFTVLEVWRVHTYGHWMPNTTLVKADFGVETLRRGRDYVAFFVLVELPVVAMPWVWARAVDRYGAPRGAWLVLVGIAVPVWAMVVGGDYMGHSRFVVPAIPLLALANVAWLEGPPAWQAVVITAVVALLCSASAANLNLVPERVLLKATRLDDIRERGEYRFDNGVFMRAGNGHLRRYASAIALITKPGDTITASAVGNLGYFNPDIDILDLCGLTNREVARRPVEPEEGGRPGHDKCTRPSIFVDDEPDIIDWVVLNKAEAEAAEIEAKARGVLKHLKGGQLWYPRLRELPVEEGNRAFILYFPKAEEPWLAEERRQSFFHTLREGRLPLDEVPGPDEG